VSSRWVTKRAISLHVTLALALASFGALTWWQVRRAISGNTLSYVYSFEWPLFAGYAVYLWWKLVHEEPIRLPRHAAATETGSTTLADASPGEERSAGAGSLAMPPERTEPLAGGGKDRSPRSLAPEEDRARRSGVDAGRPAPPDPEATPVDEELAAYNRYLAELAAAGNHKQLFSSRRGRRRS
jgi:hypothetical protein